jgi:SagB-type dehydrogenase family enzyme
VLFLERDQVVFHNYLTQTTFVAEPVAVELVRVLETWNDVDHVAQRLKSYSSKSVRRAVDQLVDLDVLIIEGSEAARRDAAFERSWLWGPFAAAYHFGSQGGVFLSDQDGEAMLRSLAQVSPSPPLYLTHADDASAIPAPQQASYEEPFRTLAARRTNRVMLAEPMSMLALSDSLLFSMAITAMLNLPGIGDLPLKMTPSGGARNPYEAYVCVRRVDDLAPGIYHYSALQRSFRAVSPGPPPPFPVLLGNQEWTAPAAAVILLVANFERPMWKYHDPAAYRVTAIEAGHIAQNITLVATKYGLVGNPTALINATEVADTLGLTALTQSAMYAVVLGVPAPPGDDDVPRVFEPG